jgi:mono/diheme cytochrome c family protein
MAAKNENLEDSAKPLLRSAVNVIFKIPALLTKAVYILPFILFAAWLLQLLYFPKLEVIKLGAARLTPILKPTEEQDVFSKILTSRDPVSSGHFHMIDEYISQPETMAPLCLTCHGNYPHSKERKVRALLNSHTGFIACAVCHAQKKLFSKDTIFAWVERETGEIVSTVKGQYGKYPAKIFPVHIDTQGQKKIVRPVEEKAAGQYLKIKDKYNPDQAAQAKIKLHENISTTPVFCSDCHTKNGYLDFKELGFPVPRVNHLNSTEVVGLVEKYKTFYLPSVIDFSSEKTFGK